LIDSIRLELALSMQEAKPTYAPVGEILRDLGYLSRDKLRDVIKKYGKQILLGELLVKMGVISGDQLEIALRIQKRSPKRLGRVLVEKGFVTKSRLADAICFQLGIESADATMCLADGSLVAKVNKAFLKSRRVMPLKYNKTTNTVTLLMVDPTDKKAVAELESIFHASIEPVMLRGGWMEYLIDGILDVWHISGWRKIGVTRTKETPRRLRIVR
jgi:hypothetical protein